jgi:hypothetical protein
VHRSWGAAWGGDMLLGLGQISFVDWKKQIARNYIDLKLKLGE